MNLETLDHYRPWCRYCGAQEGECVIATEYDPWVQDEDDFGYPVCLPCVKENTPRPTLTLVSTGRTWCCDPNDPRDCAERDGCPDAGKPGHTACGICVEHGLSRHRHGCAS